MYLALLPQGTRQVVHSLVRLNILPETAGLVGNDKHGRVLYASAMVQASSPLFINGWRDLVMSAHEYLSIIKLLLVHEVRYNT